MDIMACPLGARTNQVPLYFIINGTYFEKIWHMHSYNFYNKTLRCDLTVPPPVHRKDEVEGANLKVYLGYICWHS